MRFDQATFFQAIERQRQDEGLSWRQLASQIGLSPSTFSRLSQGRRPDVDTFVKVLAWLGRPATDFVDGGSGSTESKAGGRNTVRAIRDSLRDDPALSSDNANALEEIVRVAYHRLRSTGADGD